MPGITTKSERVTVRLNIAGELLPIQSYLESVKKHASKNNAKDYVTYSVGEFIHAAIKEKLAHIQRSRRSKRSQTK